MRNIQKIKFSDIKGMLENDEMREITGGYGTSYACGSSSNNFGAPGYGGSTGAGSNALSGFGGGTAIGTTFGGVPYIPDSSSSGNNGATGGSSNYGSSSYTAGWTYSNGRMTTNDPAIINRWYDVFMHIYGTTNTTSDPYAITRQINTFVNNEFTLAGQQENIRLYGTVLNGLPPLVNNYKGPSTIAPGLMYNNGMLEYDNTYGGNTMSSSSSSGTTQPKTPAILVPFTNDELINGLNKLNFANIERPFIEDWDQAKGQYNNSTRFKANLKLNVDGLVSIALYEKLSLTVYDYDSNKGLNTTIGFGHLIHSGAIKDGDIKSISLDQAISYFANDIIETERALNQKIENMNMTGIFTRSQYFALVDMAYNSGIGNERNQTITYQVLEAMSKGGTFAANNVITNAYINESNGGVKDRRYFEAEAFVNGRSITPEEANAELIKLGLKK